MINFIGPWSNWNECSVSCGTGVKFRTRSCIAYCENRTIENKDCYKGCCPGNEIKYLAYVYNTYGATYIQSYVHM